MAGKVTVDTTDETIGIEFVDKDGNATDAPAELGPVTFVASDPNIATVAAAEGTALKNAVTPTGVGRVTFTLNPLTKLDGTPLLEPDGVTPFPQLDPIDLEVDAGQAVGARLVLAESSPASSPSPSPPSSPSPEPAAPDGEAAPSDVT